MLQMYTPVLYCIVLYINFLKWPKYKPQGPLDINILLIYWLIGNIGILTLCSSLPLSHEVIFLPLCVRL